MKPRARGLGMLRLLLCVLAIGAGIGAAELRASARTESGDEADQANEDDAQHAASWRVGSFRVPADSGPDERTQSMLGEQWRDGRIITGTTKHRLILFTFDDGPDRRSTPLLLDRLDRAGVKAVFFLVAERFAGNSASERMHAGIAREIARRGHVVANHTLSHEQLPTLDTEGARKQILGAEAAFERVFGGRPWLFRPPFGARSARIDELTASRGYTTVLWNMGGGDFQVRSADEVFDTWQRVFKRREQEDGDRGGVILLHDTYPWTVDAFERIVSYLRDRNCELLAKGEELYDFVDDPALFFVPREGAGASVEAPAVQVAPDVIAARQAKLRERESERCRSFASEN